MNTGQLNKDGQTRGVGMARMDILDYARKSEPIFDPMATVVVVEFDGSRVQR